MKRGVVLREVLFIGRSYASLIFIYIVRLLRRTSAAIGVCGKSAGESKGRQAAGGTSAVRGVAMKVDHHWELGVGRRVGMVGIVVGKVFVVYISFLRTFQIQEEAVTPHNCPPIAGLQHVGGILEIYMCSRHILKRVQAIRRT